MMMNAEERLAQSIGKGLPGFETDEQRRGQARALRGGDSIQLARGDSCFGQCGGGHREEVAQMFAGGQFGNDAAIFRVEFDLRGNH